MVAKGKARAINLLRYPSPIATRCSPSSIRCDADAGNKSRVAWFALAATMLCASAPVAQTEADHAATARAALTEVIRPGYASFGEATSALSGNVDTLCK